MHPTTVALVSTAVKLAEASLWRCHEHRIDALRSVAAPVLATGSSPGGATGQAIDIHALLAEVDVPVTVVWGATDQVLPPPDDVDERVEAGHMLHMEAANDVVRVLRARV